MKNKLAKMVCLLLAMTMLLSTGAMAAAEPTDVGLMTGGHIEKLKNYGYTSPEYAIGYEEAKTRFSASTLKFLYGDRSGFDDFNEAHNHLYNTMKRINTYCFPALGKILNGADNETFFEHVLDEAVAEVSYKSEHLTVTFHADKSCLYQGDCMDRTTAAVRGTAEVTLHVTPLKLEGAETALLCRLGFTQLYQDKAMYIDIDVHMNTQPDCNVNIHSIVPLGEAY